MTTIERESERLDRAANDRHMCHVFPNDGGVALCGSLNVLGVRVAEFANVHRDGRCTLCGERACLTCDLIASGQ